MLELDTPAVQALDETDAVGVDRVDILGANVDGSSPEKLHGKRSGTDHHRLAHRRHRVTGQETATTRPANHLPADQEQRGPQPRGSTTNRSAKLNHIFPLQRENRGRAGVSRPCLFTK